jgi:uncharacterized membrane protein
MPDSQKNTHRAALFLVAAAILLQSLYLVILPPFQSPDDFNHFCRAYQLSEGEWLPYQENQRLGGWMPVELKAFFDPYLPATFMSRDKFTAEKILESLHNTSAYSGREFIDFPNTSYYSVVSYLPQATAIAILRTCGCSMGVIYFGGKLFAFAIWLLVMFVVIRRLPLARWLFVALLLLPTNMATLNSYSADNMTNLLTYVLISLVLESLMRASALSKRRMGLLLLLGVLLALAKVVYVSLLLLVFLLPLNVFTGRKQRGMFFVLLFLLSGLTALYWSGVVTDKFLTYAQYNEAFRNQCTLAPESDYGLQKQALSQNPLHLVRLFYNALFHNPEFYLKSYVGHFGTYLDTPMPYWLFESVYVFLILLAFFEPNPFLLGVRQKFLLLGAALAAYLLLILSHHLTWNKVGSEFIDSIQGRYLAPIFPLIFLLFTRLDAYASFKSKASALFAMAGILGMNFICLQILHDRYYKEEASSVSVMYLDFEKNKLQTSYALLSATDLDSLLTNEQSYNGLRSVKLNKQNKECEIYHLDALERGCYLSFTVWSKGHEPYLKVQSDTSLSCKELYQTGASSFQNQKGWKQIRFILSNGMPCDLANIRLFLGHESDSTVFFDGLNVLVKHYK